MKRIYTGSIIGVIILGFSSSLYAAIDFGKSMNSGEKTGTKTESIAYPSGSDFAKLKEIIEKKFIEGKDNYGCINGGKLCPGPKYTPITEKLLKLIVTSSYKGNEKFYEKLFSSYSSFYNNPNNTIQTDVDATIKKIPASTYRLNNILGSNTYAGNLLESSFGIDFTDQSSSSSTFLSALRTKIESLKQTKCQTANSGDYNACPYGNISNIYLPTPSELMKESIYMNGSEQKIMNFRKEYFYIINPGPVVKLVESGFMPKIKEEMTKNDILTDLQAPALAEKNAYKSFYQEIIDQLSNSPDIVTLNNISKKIRNHENTTTPNLYRNVFIFIKNVVLDYRTQLSTSNPTYTVDYRKKEFTLDEANTELAKKLPENKNANMSPLGAMFKDGKISTEKKDYKALMKGETAKDIPAIMKHIPKDSAFAYVKNPQNMISILNSGEDTTSKITGINIKDEVKKLMQYYFELDDFTKIEKNLKNEMAIVMLNLDFTAPELMIIISEKDKEALSSSSKAQVLATKGGYIFISPSKKLVEKFTSIKEDDSVYKSIDLEYLWWKKGSTVKDMFIFAGDQFFEKMTTFENFVNHFRKYKDFGRLQNIQQLVWAYKDYTGKNPTSIKEIIDYLGKFSEIKIPDSALEDYKINGDIVEHKNIGSLKNINNISDSNYDLTKISRSEIESYKASIMQYKEVWRANLDPMGVSINKFADGVEVDFFMTPIPKVEGELGRLFSVFENATKDKLDFIANPKVRSGLVSFVYGFDPSKMKAELDKKENVNREFNSINEEILDGKNIMDYLGGEFAFTIGSVDPDIFEGWNVDKVDAYLSIQVTDTDKGKELVELLRQKITSKFKGSGGDESLSKTLELFAKPMIEEYRGNKLYYVSDIPFPFVGKLGISYAYVNNFIVLSINKQTIKKAIDASIDGDKGKATIVDEKTGNKGTFFGFLLDGVNTSKQISSIIKKNPGMITSIGSYFNTRNSSVDILSLLSAYYTNAELYNRLGKGSYDFKYNYGFTTITSKDGELYASIDRAKTETLSGSTKKNWESIKSKIEDLYFSTEGKEISGLFSDNILTGLKSITSEYMLLKMFNSNESLFSNMTFTMNLGNDEVGYKLRIFKDKLGANSKKLFGGANSSAIIVTLLALGTISIFGGAVFMIGKKKALAAVVAPVAEPVISTIL